jgi:hypothetical protein
LWLLVLCLTFDAFVLAKARYKRRKEIPRAVERSYGQVEQVTRNINIELTRIQKLFIR